MTRTTTTQDRPAGWYAKTCAAQPDTLGPFPTKRAACVAIRSVSDVITQGMTVWCHRGGLMLVYV